MSDEVTTRKGGGSMRILFYLAGGLTHREKCIATGEYPELPIPRKGELVCVKDGFAAHEVKSVTYDFAPGVREVEVRLRGEDADGEYEELRPWEEDGGHHGDPEFCRVEYQVPGSESLPGGPDLWICTRPPGHAGPHEARGSGEEVFFSWEVGDE